ncbi:MAG: FadR/GntR family transcriptional regulator [Hyphomicrobiales bacterium]
MTRASEAKQIESDLVEDGRLPAPKKAIRAIQDMIREELSPGECLPAQRVLAERLKVSRASLREALSTLEALGFVRTEQGRGTFVTDGAVEGAEITEWRFSDRYKLEEVYQFRQMVEPTVARLAAMNITDEEIAHLTEIHERFKAAIQALDLISSTEHDVDFHRSIMAISRNRVFVDLYDKFRKVFEETQMLPFSQHNRRWEVATEHGKILEALQRRDPDGAAYYMSMHMVRATDRIGVKLKMLD